jgi:hypothetical protein
MKIDISRIVANPFRDFDLDPLDNNQVDKLEASIDDLGFFTAIPVRFRNGVYEQACNHHLLEAARRVAAKKKIARPQVEVVLEDYDDNAMRRIMAIENLTQRGANTGAQLDAVAAFSYQVAYEILSEREEKKRQEATENRDQFSVYGVTASGIAGDRGIVLRDGPGDKYIYRAINGFPHTERKAQKAADEKAEMITQYAIVSALTTLRASGKMGEIVARAYAVVEEERKEDEAKAEAERQKEEARIQREEERQRKAEKAEQDRLAKERYEANRALERAEKEKAAQAERDRLAKEKAAAEAEWKAQRQKEIEAENQRRKEAAARHAEHQRQAAEKRAKEDIDRAKLQAQLDMERVYDNRCNTLFPEPDYATAFRKAVLSPGAKEIIPKAEQYKIAQTIVEQAASWKKFSNHKVGTEFIAEFIAEMVREADEETRRDAKARQAALDAAKARVRVNKLWDQVKSGIITIDRSMQELVKEHQQWNRDQDGDFPSPGADMTDTYGTLSRLEEMMRRIYGGRWGVPEADKGTNIKRMGGQ